jgi:hypothetical protein
MIYLYGLLEPQHAAEPEVVARFSGVTGPVSIADLDTARLVYGPAETADILPRRRHLLAHAHVLEALTDGGAVLPMRFGMVADLSAITSVLSGQSADIAAQFDAIRGCAEYGIRVSFQREAALSATVAEDPALAAERVRLAGRGASGRMETAEFGRRLADRLDRRRAAAQRDFLAALSGEFAAHVLRAPDDDVQALAIDALVRENRAEALAQRIEALARDSAFAPGAEPQVRIVGPGPAYSFVRLTLETARWAA